ncbi:Cadherin domain protein [Marinobacterium sp. xm-d-579]|uniref:cadherin repeat domain-containing protein n=1 Tax=unclassified Marinobacterium TaxID=2644139 RepID=UPI001569C8B1|nr:MULTISPECIES: cadherin repeat domain-containing protein [unclassified Marinobacterium]NRP10924.1 Cadherin domain protein [Marinobacterium sp. xm-g-48]NRP37347.1 Cadherin domain protein [Marinobacterium sp. xm-d-579]NRP95619.1 Cadherin domain protein [Marinobacterium sp. xm-g-59]
MILDQRQVLIKEDFESASTVYDVAEMRELLARAGASYTLLDGSSLSPIPFVEGRQNGPNLELLLPDGTIVIIREFFGDMGTPYSTQTMLASFGPETEVYFPDYVPGLMQASYGGLSGAIPMFGTAAPAAAAGGISPAMMAMGAAAPAAALLAPTPEGGDINISVGGVGGTVAAPAASITSIVTTFGTELGIDEDVDDAVVTVKTANIDNGETIELEFAGTTYEAVVSNNKALFAIEAAELQALDDGLYDMVATLVSDATVTNDVGITLDRIAPVFDSDELALSFDEGTTDSLLDSADIGVALATDETTLEYSIDGADKAACSVNSLTGAIKFKEAPDFEAPSDDDGDNIYELTLIATDIAGNVTEKAITIEVLDVDESDTTAPELPTVDTQNVSDTLPIIEGTAVLGASEQLTVAVNGVVVNVTPDENGDWALNLRAEDLDVVSGTLSELEQGVIYDVEATVTNSESQLSSTDETTSELRVAPPSPTVNDLAIVNVESPVFTGTSPELNENLKLIVKLSQTTSTGEELIEYEVTPVASQTEAGVYEWTLDTATATPLETSRFATELSLPLNDGDYTVTARIAMYLDGTELMSSDLAVDDFTVDLSASVAPVVTDSVSGQLSPTVSGTANLKQGETLDVSVIGTDQQIIVTFEDVTVVNGAWSIDLATAVPVSGEWVQPAAGSETSFDVRAVVPESGLESTGTLDIDQAAPTVKLWIDTTETLTENNAGMYQLNILFSEKLAEWPPDFSGLQISGLSLAVDDQNTLIAPIVDPQNPLKFTADFVLDKPFEGIGSAVIPADTYADLAGNGLELLELFNPEVDTVAPSELSLSITDTGASASDGITRTSIVQVFGLEKYAVLNYSLDAGETFIEALPPSGGWTRSGDTYVTTIALPEGVLTSKQVQAYQVDASGNTGDQVSLFLDRNYTIDTSLPYFSEMLVSYVIDENDQADVTVVAKLDASATIDWTTLVAQTDASYLQLSNLVGEPNQAALVVPADTTGVTSELTFVVQGVTVDDTTLNIAPDAVFLDTLVVSDLAGNEIPQYSPVDEMTTVTYNVGASILGVDTTEGVLRPDAEFSILSFASPAGAKIEFTLDGYDSLVASIDTSVTSAGYLGSSTFDLTALTALQSAQLDNTNINYSIRMLDSAGDLIIGVPTKSGVFTFDSTPPTAPIFVDSNGDEITGGLIELLENQPYQSTLFFIAQSDDTSSITYELSAEDQQYFQINPDTGGVSIRQDAVSGLWQFDFESLVQDRLVDQDTKEITLTVNAVDAAGNIGGTASIAAHIGNLDESAPQFQDDGTAEDDYDAVRVVEEYVEAGALVYSPGTVTDIYDDDSQRDVSDQVVFSLARTGDFQLLTVDPDTGDVSINASPDYDLKSVYTFTLIATGADGKTATQNVRLDVNESGTAANFVALKERNIATGEWQSIELSEMRLSLATVEENTDLSAYAWELRVDDPAAVLTLLDGSVDFFTITQNADSPEYWDLVFKDDVTFDYETLSTLNFRIRATDEQGVPKDLPLTVAVLDDGTNPVFDSALENIETPEVLAGTTFQPSIATLASGVNGTIEYSIVENSELDVNDEPIITVPFSVDSSSGAITALENLDYESNASNGFSFTLRASNGDEFSDKTLTVAVSDVAPNAAQVISAEWNVSPLQGATLPLQVTFDKPVTPSDVQGVKAVLHLTGADSLGNPVVKELNAALQSVDPNDASSLLFQVTQPMDTDFVGTVSVHAIVLDDGVTLTGAGGNADLIFSAIDVAGEWSFNNIQPTVETVELETTSFTLSYSEQLIIPANTEINVTKVGTDEIVATFTSGTDATQSDTLVFDLATSNGVSLDDLKGGSLVFDLVLGQLTGVDSNNTAKSYYDYDQTTFVDIDGSVHDYNSDTSTWIVAGEFVTDSLIVKAYTLEGELLGETDFNPLNGAIDYVDLMPASYSGPAIINILDGSAELDYLDEFSGELKDYGQTTAGFGLRALINYEDSVALEPISVTPLTELALRLAEANSVLDLDAAYDQAMAQLYGLFSLTDTRGQITVTTADGFDTADGISAAENHGLVLAALSTLDNLTGGINSTLDLLDPASGLDQCELDPLIADAVQAVAASENPYVQQIAPELTQVLEQFYDYYPMVIAPFIAPEGIEPNTDLLDLSAYLSDESDFEMLIDGEIQELSTTDDAVAAAQPATPDSILNNTQVVTPAGVDHIDAETDVNIYG